MTELKYGSPFEACEDTGSSAHFYSQFKTAVPQLDCVYKVVGCGIITDYVRIIALVDKVAIGKVIRDNNGNHGVGQLNMYNTSGISIGWKYREQRSGYRLQELTKGEQGND